MLHDVLSLVTQGVGQLFARRSQAVHGALFLTPAVRPPFPVNVVGRKLMMMII